MAILSPFETGRKALLGRATKMPHFALQSQATKGFVEVEAPRLPRPSPRRPSPSVPFPSIAMLGWLPI